MKYTILTFIVFLSITSFGQKTIHDTITHDGMERAFIVYVPKAYVEGTNVPLLFNFHGYTSKAKDQMWYGEFRHIADTANFIIAYPMGTKDSVDNTHWNVGWAKATTDDVAFTSALIDSLAADYSIDQKRIYSTGMSNGGFMSFKLACELSDRIAAIASVAGSMQPFTLKNSKPSHPMPILQIHGDIDGMVPYKGDSKWTRPIESLIKDWTTFNKIKAKPTVVNLPDEDPDDGSTVIKTTYQNTNNCVEVIHYKVIGGDHAWPGSIIELDGTNYDFDASEVIWAFLSKYNMDGLIDCGK
jgi:polyhydroxybutyrate depolymerase